MASCAGDHYNETTDTEQYTNALNRIKGEEQRSYLTRYYFDSLFARRKNVSPYVFHVKYMSLCHYFDKYEIDDSMLLYLDSAMAVMDRADLIKKYPYDMIGCLNYKGQIMYDRGEFSEAYNSYFRARQIALSVNDTCMMNDCAYSMGMLYYKEKKYKEAQKQFREANVLALKCRPLPYYHMQQNLNNIALCYEKMKKLDSALYVYDSTWDFIQQNAKYFPDSGYRIVSSAVVNGNIGGVLLTLGYADSAIHYLERSFNANILSKRDEHDALLTHTKLARAYLMKQQPDRLVLELRKIDRELDSIRHSPADESDVLRLWYSYYQIRRNTDSAILSLQKYLAVKDQVWEGEHRKAEADAERELARKEQAYRMAVLQKQNRTNSAYLWVVAAFLVMALAIALLIYRSYRIGRRNIEMLTRLKNRLEEKDKEKDRIMNIVAHDLRGPVSGVYQMAHLLNSEDMPENVQRYLGLIRSTLKGSLDLVNELMVYNDERQEQMRKEPVDMVRLLDEAIQVATPRATDKGITLLGSLPQGTTMVEADRGKIARVVNNLIINAIKFSGENGVVEIGLEHEGKRVLIRVKDSGIGIPQKMQEYIFDMFTTARRTGTKGERSFGLGLFIARQEVEAHGGHIWAESEEGKGTTFYVVLPG